MNFNQMKDNFDNSDFVKELRRLGVSGSVLEKADARSKLKYAWFVWEVCWSTAWKCYQKNKE